MKNIPIYRYPWSKAMENGTEALYRESMKANVACKKAVEKAISDNYKGWCLDTATAIAQLDEQFGLERVKYVLANTIQCKDWDGRISSANKAWAKGFTIACAEYHSDHLRFVVDKVNPGLVDLLATAIRKQIAENALPNE